MGNQADNGIENLQCITKKQNEEKSLKVITKLATGQSYKTSENVII